MIRIDHCETGRNLALRHHCLGVLCTLAAARLGDGVSLKDRMRQVNVRVGLQERLARAERDSMRYSRMVKAFA